jgi:outer membrane protein TolC
MSSTRNGRLRTRHVARGLVCTSLLAGCSHNVARPSVDLPPPTPSRRVDVETTSLLSSCGPLSVESVPGDRSRGVDGPSVNFAAQEVVPTVGDHGMRAASASDPVSTLPLPTAIFFALQYNPRLRAALAAIERARGQTDVAFAPFLPQIDLLNRYVATGKSTVPGAPGPTGAVNPSVIGPYQVCQTELQLQWTLYDFGRTAGRYGQADLREKIARLQALRAQETVAYDVAAAYLQVLEATAFRRIAAESVRRAEAVLEDVRVRREGGVALKDDVLRGQVQLSESRVALVRAEDAEIAALARLNNAMGRDASLPLRLADAPDPCPFTAALADSLQRAATQRPEVGVARDRVAVARFGRVAARGEFLPNLAMKGSLGRIEGENVVGGWQEGASIQLNVPVYHGGANRGNMTAAEADISQAVAEAQGVLNDISLEVTVAHRDVVSARTRVELARPAVEQSAEALRIVRGRYREGIATPTDVLDAETTRTRAEQTYASAQLEFLAALARLAYVLGEDPGGLGVSLAGPVDPTPAALPMPRPVPGQPPGELPMPRDAR